MFEPLKNIINNVVSLDIDEIMKEIWGYEDVQELIIELNTNNQLFLRGIDSKGNEIVGTGAGGGYSNFTINIKSRKGQPTDRITLRDTGDFYESFRIVPNNFGFTIEAYGQKDSDNLFEIYGIDILGLTGESIEELISKTLTTIQNEIQLRILA